MNKAFSRSKQAGKTSVVVCLENTFTSDGNECLDSRDLSILFLVFWGRHSPSTPLPQVES